MPLLMCPNCNATMQTVNRDGVQLDMCSQCRGIWLDRGELEKLLGGFRQADHEWQEERDYYRTKYKDDAYYKKHKHQKSGLHRFLDMFD